VTRSAAAFAALRLILKIPARVERLFAGREDKFGAAFLTAQDFVVTHLQLARHFQNDLAW
jgi:hypothetical protein